MASDLLRESERAALITLKGNAPLLAIVAKPSINPTPGSKGVDGKGNAIWPFIRLEGSQSVLAGRGCTARAEVTFQVHSFAKPRYNISKTTLETARDHAARINSAVVEAIHKHAFVVDGRRYRFTVGSSRLMRDGAETDGWHGIANVVARAFNG